MRHRLTAVLFATAVLATACSSSTGGAGGGAGSPPSSATPRQSPTGRTTKTVTANPTPTTSPSPAASGSEATVPGAIASAAKAPPTWAQTFDRVSTGVVRIDDLCDDQGAITTGTGFLVAPNLVATVAHVVEGAGTLRVTSPSSGLVTGAQIVGFDHAQDLALLRTDATLPGHQFTLARSAPSIGTEMAAIGFPLAQSMQLTIGHITGTHNHREVGGEFDLSDVLLSDAALNPGNSGGPWLTQDGQVVALDESGPPYDDNNQQAQGNNGGVSVSTAGPLFDRWASSPQQPPARGCQVHTPVNEAIETLDLYFYAINQSDYATAYAQLDSSSHPISGLDAFVKGVESTTDESTTKSDYYTLDNQGRSNGLQHLDVDFRSHQHPAQGPDGERCTLWTLRYVFHSANGLQLIDTSVPTPGTRGHRGC